MLNEIMNSRRALFSGGNYNQYVQAYGIRLPAICVILDNYSSFREKTNNAYENIILRLAREGIGYGIYFVLSSAGFGHAGHDFFLDCFLMNQVKYKMPQLMSQNDYLLAIL